jgi:iron complex outermembrane recepter protein
MKKLFTTLVLASISFGSFAQDGGKIFGKIKDGGNQKTIDAATISLLKASDSSLLKTAVTDKEGNFSFENVREGNYLVVANSVGHAKTYSQPIPVSAANLSVNTGTLQLEQAGKNMAEVVVTAKKQFIERKIDKVVINPEAMISNAGATALEMLEKAPGITIDKDGKISLKGKQGVIIMMDGKPSYLSGPDLVNYLTNLPAGNIDQVEIMSNPPAKYDAAGNSGIINIKSKKSKQKGFNGSVSTSQSYGQSYRTANTLSLNYRKGKVNTFSTFNANYRENPQWLDINREYLQDNKSVESIFEQESHQMRISRYYNARVGMDFYATEKTTLGLVFTGYINPSNENSINNSKFYNPSRQLDSSLKARSVNDGQWNHNGVNLNLRHKFDSTGRELTVDFDYLHYGSRSLQEMTNTGYAANQDQKYQYIRTGDLPSTLDIFSLKADYVKNLGKKIKMETGFKSSYITTDNKAKYYLKQGSETKVDYNSSNYFEYKENLNAAYINFSTEKKKWSFQTGLRIENTNYEGLQYGNPTRTDSSFQKSYTSAFPTMYVSYQMNKKNQFGLNYGRRINRPDYGDLNPFFHFIDPYTYEVGNPFLKPMFSNNLELSHAFKNILNTSLTYTQTRDLFGESFSREDSAIVVRNANFGKSDNVNLSVGVQLPVAKWWKANINSQVSRNMLTGTLNGNEVDIDLTMYTLSVNNQLTFKKGWSAELSAFYRSKGSEGQIVIRQITQLNAGVQKQVLKNKGSLKLSINDFTGPMKVSGYIEDVATAKASFKQHRDSRFATLTFNYRFGKMYKADKRKSGGAGDEQNRIKGAN